MGPSRGVDYLIIALNAFFVFSCVGAPRARARARGAARIARRVGLQVVFCHLACLSPELPPHCPHRAHVRACRRRLLCCASVSADLCALLLTGLSAAIETHYCSSPLTPASADEPYMVRVTREYAETSNPLFLSRPEWLRVATCVSAYGLVWGYVAVLAMFILRLDALRTPVLMFVGCKSYAIFQYWLMEFTAGPLSPPDLPSFLGPELPYVISLALVSARLLPSATPFAGGGAARNAKRD